MLEQLKRDVYEANMDLQRYGLITFTWGNASGIDREQGLFVIKPSGVPYERLTADMMTVMDLKGNKVEGNYAPSSDVKTHLVLYNSFPKIGGIVHTHSLWATSWAQAGTDIPCYGTTHADYFYGSVPCVRNLTKEEIDEDYEYNTGVLIAEYFLNKSGGKSCSDAGDNTEEFEKYIAVPAVLCKNHGPFTWGKSANEAVYHAVVLEKVAEMAAYSKRINPDLQEAPRILQDKHYLRKHGKNAYYGQKGV
ncbi:L-ribulose-5-phosphate 4-epimerase [Treponema sp.]|uniref:L-ribulose-5-phosphate 4-epimerase n=1 Tax=Treponema sp. TaxID=166 RepID=UPI003FA237AB